MVSLDPKVRYANAESARMGLWQARLEDDDKQRRRAAAPPSRSTISTGVLARVLLNHAKNRPTVAPSLVDRKSEQPQETVDLEHGHSHNTTDFKGLEHSESTDNRASRLTGDTALHSSVNSRGMISLLKHGKDELGCPACGRAYDIEAAPEIAASPDMDPEENQKKSKLKSTNTWKDKKASRGTAGRELATSPPLTRQDLQVGVLLTLLVGVCAAVIGTIFSVLLN